MTGWNVTLQLLGIWFILAMWIIFYRGFTNFDINSSASSYNSNPIKIDAVVYIAMNTTAGLNNIDYSIESLRKIGKWKGDILIITDRPNCFEYITSKHNVEIITTQSKSSLIEIKSIKPNLFEYIPSKLSTVLYLDADIIVAHSLQNFLQTVSADISLVLTKKKSHSGMIDFAMFPDARGHYAGWCSGCEKWHTGVILVSRSNDGLNISTCLREWNKQLMSGRYDTDQESIDAAEESGACPLAVTISPQHLLFAKDYIAMLMVSGQTFIHMTGVERKQSSQDLFYSNVVAPRIYRSMEPLVSRHVLQNIKTC